VALSTQYDSIFAKHAGKMPVAFLRALSYRESQINPNAANPGGADAAKGILQVVGVVRNDYNKRHGTNYQPDDLFDPDLNTAMATETLNAVISGYGKHPSKNLQLDFTNPEFVKLLVAGWNAGYSEAGGVGKVARYLEANGIPVTHDNVFAYASQAGATVHLTEPDRQQWQRSVADLYYAQPDRFASASSGALTVLLVAFVGWGIYQLVK
jgi:soluble lytic murein transglycosylase-like protein